MQALPSLQNFDFVAGLYVFCYDYHLGQTSRLYRIASRIDIRLSDNDFTAIRLGVGVAADEWIDAHRVYCELIERYKDDMK